MNLLKKICTMCIVFVLPFITCSCNNSKPTNANSLFGILIYQKVPDNENYESNKDNIKNFASINDSTISTSNLYLLYFNYETPSNTNTTHVLDNNNKLSLEIYLETTEITACLIYKDKNNILSYSNFITTPITEENTTIYILDNLTITVSKNLSYKKG